jgi:hypothetical protein
MGEEIIFSHLSIKDIMKKELNSTKWLRSKEVIRALKIPACDVMHLREAGKLKFIKQGNAFLYEAQSVFENKK